MSKILLVGKNESFLHQCAEKLRWLDHKVFIHNDVMNGLREMLVSDVSCIVWDVEVNDQERIRKYRAIKRYHRYTPLIIIDDNKEAYQDEDLDHDTVIRINNPRVEDVVHQVIDAITDDKILSDEDRLDRLEKEFGLFD